MNDTPDMNETSSEESNGSKSIVHWASTVFFATVLCWLTVYLYHEYVKNDRLLDVAGKPNTQNPWIRLVHWYTSSRG